MNSARAQQVHVSGAGRVLGVTPRYLKLLEAAGVVPAPNRDERGYRTYSQADIDLLKDLGVGSRPRKLKRPEKALGV